MRQVRYSLTEELGCLHRHIPPFLPANGQFGVNLEFRAKALEQRRVYRLRSLMLGMNRLACCRSPPTSGKFGPLFLKSSAPPQHFDTANRGWVALIWIEMAASGRLQACKNITAILFQIFTGVRRELSTDVRRSWAGVPRCGLGRIEIAWPRRSRSPGASSQLTPAEPRGGSIK
jgi:hypothetical protein